MHYTQMQLVAHACTTIVIVHLQELSLLQDFDKREVVFIEKRSAKMVDRNVSGFSGLEATMIP
jgi:hypothetical protein